MRLLAWNVVLLALLCVPRAWAVDYYTSGHADLGIGYHNGELEPHLHAEGAIIGGSPQFGEFEAEDVIILVPNSTKTLRPAGSQWAFLGVAAGEPIWYLPQSGTLANSLGAPFLGLGAEELDAADWSGNITLSITGISGPADGHFSLWQDGFTPNVLLSTAQGVLSAPGLIEPEGHDHANWGFSKPGVYEITFQASGTHVVDGPVVGTATFTFEVVPEPSSLALAALGLAGLAAVWANRRRKR